MGIRLEAYRVSKRERAVRGVIRQFDDAKNLALCEASFF